VTKPGKGFAPGSALFLRAAFAAGRRVREALLEIRGGDQTLRSAARDDSLTVIAASHDPDPLSAADTMVSLDDAGPHGSGGIDARRKRTMSFVSCLPMPGPAVRANMSVPW
jgi:hypothetical protein